MRPAHRASSLVLLTAVALTVGAAACASDDGRQLPPAGPDQTRSILTTTSLAPSSTDAALASEVDEGALLTSSFAELALTLPWEDDAVIDARFTCAGEDISPSVSWANVPEGTVEVAIVMTDSDASGFVHWVLAGLDPALGTVAEGSFPATAIQATNSFGTVGYRGPCPPPGESHTYLVEVFAIGQQLELADGTPASDLITAIEASAISVRSLGGRYP